MDASIAQDRAGDAVAGPVPAADLEDALFAEVRQHLESMIGWARSEEALASMTSSRARR